MVQNEIKYIAAKKHELPHQFSIMLAEVEALQYTASGSKRCIFSYLCCYFFSTFIMTPPPLINRNQYDGALFSLSASQSFEMPSVFMEALADLLLSVWILVLTFFFHHLFFFQFLFSSSWIQLFILADVATSSDCHMI